jgi:hypothetical protein
MAGFGQKQSPKVDPHCDLLPFAGVNVADEQQSDSPPAR